MVACKPTYEKLWFDFLGKICTHEFQQDWMYGLCTYVWVVAGVQCKYTSPIECLRTGTLEEMNGYSYIKHIPSRSPKGRTKDSNTTNKKLKLLCVIAHPQQQYESSKHLGALKDFAICFGECKEYCWWLKSCTYPAPPLIYAMYKPRFKKKRRLITPALQCQYRFEN